MVPDAISAWNPLIAPHAMVMNTNGKTLPANSGPVPSMNRVVGRHLERREQDEDSAGERDHDADLHERREIAARREEQPDRAAPTR